MIGVIATALVLATGLLLACALLIPFYFAERKREREANERFEQWLVDWKAQAPKRAELCQSSIESYIEVVRSIVRDEMSKR